MKKLFLLLLPITVLLNADLSVKKIEEMVLKIHEKRSGILLKTLETTKEPFVVLVEENNTSTFVVASDEFVEEKLILHAIVNGKAYVNDSWYAVGSSILGYTLSHIGDRGIVLKNDNRVKKLFLRKKSNDIIKLIER